MDAEMSKLLVHCHVAEWVARVRKS